MEVYELFAEKMVLQAFLDALYRHRIPQKSMTLTTKTIRQKYSTARNPSSVDWFNLPMELWLNIFSYLSQAELHFIVPAVCKSFHCWSRDFSLWSSIDFHKMHMDMEVLSKRGIVSVPGRISSVQVSSLLNVFRDYVTSISISRFLADCELDETLLNSICMCSSITHLDVGFCYQPDMMSKIVVNCTMIEDFNAEGCR